MIKKLENLQNIKKETNKFDSIHDAKIFISLALSIRSNLISVASLIIVYLESQ